MAPALNPHAMRILPSLVIAASLFAVAAPAALAQAPAPAPASSASSATQLENPIGVTDLNVAIGKVINAALGLSGAVALLMFVWGGVQWLISGGNADRVKAGKATLTWAAIGIVVIFTAYTLVNVLVNTVAGVAS